MPRAPMRLPAVPPPPAAAAVGEGERPARAAGSLGVRLEQRSPGRGNVSVPGERRNCRRVALTGWV